MELIHGVLVNHEPVQTYPSGHGCPLEPNSDDSSPWQDKVIRELEEG